VRSGLGQSAHGAHPFTPISIFPRRRGEEARNDAAFATVGGSSDKLALQQGPDCFDEIRLLARSMRQAGFFRDAKHEMDALNRHAGRAFAEVIQPRY
jgi:hypothetical protein